MGNKKKKKKHRFLKFILMLVLLGVVYWGVTTSRDNLRTKESESGNSEVLNPSEVPVDAIMDDTVVNTYVIAYSPLATTFAEGQIYIFEEEGKLSEEEVVARLEELSDAKGRTVNYRQVSSITMDIIIKCCEGGENMLFSILNAAADSDGQVTFNTETAEMIEELIDMGFQWEVRESTAYDLYHEIGLID